MAASRKNPNRHDGRGRPRDRANCSPESRIERTYASLDGLKVDPQDEHLLAEYTWHVHKHKGYVQTLQSLKLHRLIMNAAPGEVVDHVNGDKLDNRRSNLRICSQAENCRNNRKPRQGKTSRFKGVHRYRSGKWAAQIQVGGLKIGLGYYLDEMGAARAYDAAAVQYHGAFAAVNFPAGTR